MKGRVEAIFSVGLYSTARKAKLPYRRESFPMIPKVLELLPPVLELWEQTGSLDV